MAATLSYALFLWVGGLVFLLTEKENREVRFHAAQALVVGLALVAAWVVIGVIGVIPVIGWLVALLSIPLWLASLALWIYLMVKAYQLEHVKLPWAGDIAERWAAKIGV